MSFFRDIFEEAALKTEGSDGSSASITVVLEEMRAADVKCPVDFESSLGIQVRNCGRERATFADLLIAAATTHMHQGDDGGLSVVRLGEDLRDHLSKVRQLQEFVEERFAPESKQTTRFHENLFELSTEYRGTLLHLLRMAAADAAQFDDERRLQLLWRPIARASSSARGGTDERGPIVSHVSDPFQFQRQHGAAITARLASLHIANRFLTRKHRLYYRLQQRSMTVETRMDAATGGYTRVVTVHPAPDMDAARSTAIDVYSAVRSDATPEQCAEEGLPYDIECIRAPIFACVDPPAAAGTTFNAADGAGCVRRGLRGCLLLSQLVEDDIPVPPAISPDAAACGFASVPAPSALGSQPRAHVATLDSLFTDYTAHSELVLSPYFADTCGMHEAADLPPSHSAVCGPAMLFVYELVPNLVPLSQLIEVCGRLPESRPLFRHWAGELLRAFADIEAHCTLDVPAGGITIDNVYVTDQGARMVLRGIPWGPPCQHMHETETRRLLVRRNMRLMRCYGSIMRCLLARNRRLQGSEASVCDTPPPPSARVCEPCVGKRRVFTRAQVEAGVIVAQHETFEIILPLLRSATVSSGASSIAGGRTLHVTSTRPTTAATTPTTATAAGSGAPTGGIRGDSVLHGGGEEAGEMYPVSAPGSPGGAGTGATRATQEALEQYTWTAECSAFAGGVTSSLQVISCVNAVVPNSVASGSTVSGSASVISGTTHARSLRSTSTSPTRGGQQRRANATAPVPVTRVVLRATEAGKVSLWLRRVSRNASVGGGDVSGDSDDDDVGSVVGVAAGGDASSHLPSHDRSVVILSTVTIFPSDVSPTLDAILQNCLPSFRSHPAFTVLYALARMVEQQAAGVNRDSTSDKEDGGGEQQLHSTMGGQAQPTWFTTTFSRLVSTLACLFGIPSALPPEDDDSYDAQIASLRFLLELVYPQGASTYGHLTLGETYDHIVPGEGDEQVIESVSGVHSAADSTVDGLRKELQKGMVSAPPLLVRSLVQLLQHPYFSASRSGIDGQQKVQDDYVMYSYPLVHR